MQPLPSIEQRRKLAMMIAESLALADGLGMRLVGIALDDALAQVNGRGLGLRDDGSSH